MLLQCDLYNNSITINATSNKTEFYVKSMAKKMYVLYQII